MASLKWKNAHSAPKVEGPIRCHKCRLMCRDAEHYLSHKCQSGFELASYDAAQNAPGKVRVNHLPKRT
jgi:hypothetical protein